MHLSICGAGDLCPPKHQLAPCICSHRPFPNLTLGQSETLTAPVPVTTLDPRPKRDIKEEENDLTPQAAHAISDSYYTVVECKISKSLTALEEVVSTALDRKLVDTLIVANVPPSKEQTLARLPSGWLKKIRVRQFEVRLIKDFF